MGGNDSQSTARPLTETERNAAFQTGMKDVSQFAPGSTYARVVTGYQKKAVGVDADGNTMYGQGDPIYEERYNPAFADYSAPEYQGMASDYGKLQEDLTAGYTAPVQRMLDQERKRTDQSLSDRGVWSSGAAEKAQQDVTEKFAPQLASAGAQATNQRYALEAADKSGSNQFNLANAQQAYNSKWRPLEYLQGMYNGTGGVISNSLSSGWSI